MDSPLKSLSPLNHTTVTAQKFHFSRSHPTSSINDSTCKIPRISGKLSNKAKRTKLTLHSTASQLDSIAAFSFSILSGSNDNVNDADLVWGSAEEQQRWIYHANQKSRRIPLVTTYDY